MKMRSVYLVFFLHVSICCAQDTRDAEFLAADKVLNEAYKAVISKLDEASAQSLREAQRAWIQMRESDCAWAFSDKRDCLIDRTTGRAEELKRSQFLTKSNEYISIEDMPDASTRRSPIVDRDTLVKYKPYGEPYEDSKKERLEGGPSKCDTNELQGVILELYQVLYDTARIGYDAAKSRDCLSINQRMVEFLESKRSHFPQFRACMEALQDPKIASARIPNEVKAKQRELILKQEQVSRHTDALRREIGCPHDMIGAAELIQLMKEAGIDIFPESG